MRKRLVYICSPCRGDIEKNIEKAQRYCREAVELWDDVIPIAPHVYFTQFLDDTKPEERAAGMDMGLSLLAMCDELWVYGIENPSEGMRNEIEYAKQHQIPIRDAAELYRNREAKTLPIGDALIVLPSVGDSWACEISDGDGADDLIGIEFPPEGRAQTVLREGTGLVVDAMTRQKELLVPELGRFGAALYAPLISKGIPQGVIVLLRNIGRPEFDLADLSMAENVARQAALTLELASARLTESKAKQLEDRAQISRDLHDFAIQQLFASGMELSAVRVDLAAQDTVPQSVLDGLDKSINSIDESVNQIRQIIYSLRDPQATVPVMQRLRREVSSAQGSLGFVPKFTLTNLGEMIVTGSHTEIDDELGSDLADDVVAVVRECLSNTARHARATNVAVDIRIENHRIEITITDNGQGVKPELSRRSGLSNLAARARRHHGTFSIRPAEGSTGTKVIWTAIIN